MIALGSIPSVRGGDPFAAIAVGTRPQLSSAARWIGLPRFEAGVTNPVEPEPVSERHGP